MKQIHLIAAARPNFMKIAPLYHALRAEKWADPVVVHTGQHYDLNMSDVFFRELGLPEPHIHLGVGSGTHAEQTGGVMISYEKVLFSKPPDLVVVAGDVNSTMAAALASVKLGVKTAHLEAGLRSFDRFMPEEINRVVTDALADLLWTPSPDADENLLREGVTREKIQRVGNIMIDSLEMLRGRVEQDKAYRDYHVRPGNYGLVTLHRPANVDRYDVLGEIITALCKIAESLPLIFPVHPRTRKRLEKSGHISHLRRSQRISLTQPLGYIPFMNLVFNSRLVITDSGGIQEETTYLGIPCLTLRPNTERPITIYRGTNTLCSPKELLGQFSKVMGTQKRPIKPIEFWDGHTAGRVVESIQRSV
ncbi:MAG: UDP-N-acetylglucosamine 2-epimerase (non-hydrolyzing) [Deltaproteobacteria bacterium]|nr:UDP-N-acetylglucosamine 2-epimerase (non-hydrolyzing) [Deltaproteobacteria bacterium]